MLCENVMWKFCVSGGLVGVVGWVGDRLERLGEWETGWTVWVNGWLVGRVGWVGNWLEMFPPSFLESSFSKFPSKFPYQFVFVCLLKCLFVCFKTGFPLPVYFYSCPQSSNNPQPNHIYVVNLVKLKVNMKQVLPRCTPAGALTPHYPRSDP